jgi:hypothetical protein
VGHGRYTLYNAVNRAGANNSREVRGPLLVEVLAANRRDSVSLRLAGIASASRGSRTTLLLLAPALFTALYEGPGQKYRDYRATV